jgi:hypothetical protein
VYILELLSVSLARGNCQDLELGDNGDSAERLLKNTSDDKNSNTIIERKAMIEKYARFYSIRALSILVSTQEDEMRLPFSVTDL